MDKDKYTVQAYHYDNLPNVMWFLFLLAHTQLIFRHIIWLELALAFAAALSGLMGL